MPERPLRLTSAPSIRAALRDRAGVSTSPSGAAWGTFMATAAYFYARGHAGLGRRSASSRVRPGSSALTAAGHFRGDAPAPPVTTTAGSVLSQERPLMPSWHHRHGSGEPGPCALRPASPRSRRLPAATLRPLSGRRPTTTLPVMAAGALFFAKPAADPTSLGERPRLASWMATDHPDQVRLRAFLEPAARSRRRSGSPRRATRRRQW